MARGGYLLWGTPVLTWLWGVPTFGYPPSQVRMGGYLPWMGVPPSGCGGYLPWGVPSLGYPPSGHGGGTYLGWGVPSLGYPPSHVRMGGYLPWMGGTFLGVPPQPCQDGGGGTYLGWGYLPWGTPHLDLARVPPPPPSEQTENTRKSS